MRDEMCRVGGIAHLHGATLAALDTYRKAIPRRVGKMPGLPPGVARSLEGEWNESKVLKALRTAGSDPADRGVPSWGAFGSLLGEARFTQYWHRLSFMGEKWAVDTSETAREAMDVLEGHRLLPIIESYLFDFASEAAKVREKLLAAPALELDAKGFAYFARLERVDQEAATQWIRRAGHGHCLLFPNLACQAHNRQNENSLRGVEWSLRLVSPYAPISRALTAAFWAVQDVVPRLPEWEKFYADHAVVQWGIGQRHLTDRRTADAIRCWNKWVALSPDAEAFRKLAGVHLARGDENQWLRILESSLQQEDTGLVHAQVRVDIARHFMARKDYKRAEPYALTAAESGAAWALLCAADCECGLTKWDEAERFFRAAHLRYGHPAFDWFFTCRATGKMDREAALAAVREYLKLHGPGNTAGELVQAGRFYLLSGDPQQASTVFLRAVELGSTDLTFLFGALAADEVGDVRARSLALERAVRLDVSKYPLVPVGDAMLRWSQSAESPKPQEVEDLSDHGPVRRADAEFCVGWFLVNRGQGVRNDSLGALRKCGGGSRWVKTHAKANLEAARNAVPKKKP